MQVQPEGTLAWPRRAAIIGAGTMGLGVAECWLAAGVALRLCDAEPARTQHALHALRERVAGHVAAGLVDPALLARAEAVVAADTVAGAVAGADLVFEAVVEQRAAKRQVYAAIEEAAPADAPILTNTSSLPIDELAATLARPARFLGTHWFNPPEWTPAVEVIPAPVSDPGLVARVVDFLRACGKQPIVVGNGPGFVANRIQMAMFREALRCVEEGLATPEQVDAVVRHSFGFRLPFFGPFEIADMAGLDVYASVFGVLTEGLGERFAVPKALRELVDQGRLGIKSGAGFFAHNPSERQRLLVERDRAYAALAALLAALATTDAAHQDGSG